MTNPYPRLLATKLAEVLADTPVVCLLGPRQVGKTTLARQYCPAHTYINFDDSSLLSIAKQDPSGFIQGLPEYVILDEVQRVPELLPAIKAAVDSNRKPGRFLLTGSANLLLLPGAQESLAGRMEVLNLLPLTEQEIKGVKSTLLQRLLTNGITATIQGEQQAIQGIADIICRGGFPEPITRTPARARQWHRQYINAIIQRDVKDIAAIRDETEMHKLFEVLAYRTANLLNISNMANELQMRRETVEKYITILERLYLVHRLPAWHKNDSNRLIKTPKIHFVDSGLTATFCNLQASEWNNFSTDFGALLETFVVQQFITQATWLDDDIRFSHYRDKDQVEVDLVIEKSKKIWGVEVKKASSVQAKDGAGLNRLAAQAGAQFQGGILLYGGNNTLPLAQKNCFAVPISALWE
ncbi:MAG: ATP-binding protein [Cellvibrio sp.]|uniref:ATP-binding protein n=1 Tax=Cellvibrio sp. TaxID=1965322 RepID=UPI0031A95C78